MVNHENLARDLHSAISNKNAQEVVRLVGHHDNHDLVEANNHYTKLFQKDLAVAVKELPGSNDFIILLIDLIVKRPVFAARAIIDAVEGAGTKETALIDVLVHTPKHEIDEIKKAFADITGKDLLDRIESDTSGHFRKVLKNLLNGHNGENRGQSVINPAAEAEALYKKGEGKIGTDDDFFVDFFTRHTHEELREINRAYEAQHKHGLEKAIKSETSGAYEDALVALAIPRANYWARRIRHSIAGLGTNDILLRRAFALNTREQLREIAAVYEVENKGKDIISDVKNDTSGGYRALLLARLGVDIDFK